MLNGILFFVKQLDGAIGRWLGYIYCPVLKRPFFVNEQRMMDGAVQPVLGMQVRFEEGRIQEGKEFAAAFSVLETVADYDPDEPLFPLEVVASVYQQSLPLLRSRLESKVSVLHEEAGTTLLSITHIKWLADRPTHIVSPRQTKVEAPDPPDNQIRFGQLVRDEFHRGFGFVKEQGKGASDIFAHVKNLKFQPKLNDWLMFAIGPDGRVSWARKPLQALPWLRRRYTTFSVEALDALFQLGDEELADEVLKFRIGRVLALKSEPHKLHGEALLQKVRRLLPNRADYTFNQLLQGVEGVGRIRFWAQYGNVADAPDHAAALNERYQHTVDKQASDMPLAPMLGLLDVGEDKAKAEAIVQAWWPVQRSESMTEAEQVAATSLLFNWLREWHRLILHANLSPATRETYERRWHTLAKEFRAQFGRVGGAALGSALYEATGLLLPVPALVQKWAKVSSDDVLLDLIRDGGETGYLALTVALQRLGKIDSEPKYERVQQLLGEFNLLQADCADQRWAIMASVAEASAPVYHLSFWSAGYLPELDWQGVVSQLMAESARKVALDKTLQDEVRLAAAKRLLQLYIQTTDTPETTIIDFLKDFQEKRRRVGRSGASQKEATDLQQRVNELVRECVEERPELAFAMWEAGVLSEIPGSAALARLVELAAADEWATLPAWAMRSWGDARDLKTLLELLLGADNSHLLELPRSMLLPWLEYIVDDDELPETTQREVLLNDLLNSSRRDIVLPLLTWGLHQTSTPATYLSELNGFELEALLEAPTSGVRLAAALTLLGAAHKAADQAAVIQTLARMELGTLAVSESATLLDGYYQSATLGRLIRRKGIWHLGTYQALLQPPGKNNPDFSIDLWNPYQTSKTKLRTKKEPLDDAQKKSLVEYALVTNDSRIQHRLWKSGIIERPAYNLIHDEINLYSTESDRSGDETAWQTAYELIQALTDAQRLRFLEWVLEAGHLSVFSSWSSKLLSLWLGNLPDAEESKATWNRLLTALGTPALLNLWLADLIEHYDFEAYRLLVFTLSSADQILFLRKTFKLLAAGELHLTANQLNTVIRYSRDELGGGAVLDYSVDLALVVLGSLARDGSLPSEGSIVEVVCRYIGEDTTSLSPVGQELFAACPGRAEVERHRAPHKDVMKGRVDGIEYPASADKKKIVVEGMEFDVVNDTVELYGTPRRVSWIVTLGYDYQPGSNDLKFKPEGIILCEGRLAHKVDDESQLPFWWCCNRPCYKANQDESAVTDWQRFTLADFINTLNLPFNADAYYAFVGLINRVNRLLAHLQCRCCNHILRPVGQSDFNFYRANRFRCTNQSCEEQGLEVYLSHCLNGHCMTVIDSRDSSRCSYQTEGRPDRRGMYICPRCGGCCSKQALLRRKENIEKTYRPEMLVSHSQYKLINENLTLRLYHWERMRVFCYRCAKPMQQRHPEANYTCPDCQVEYSRALVHIEVARRKHLFEPEV